MKRVTFNAFLVQKALIIVIYFTLFEQVLSDCRLHSLSYGYYYGISQKTFADAKACCKSKEMSMVDLKTKQQRLQLRDALLTESFWAEPIGPANGLYLITNRRYHQGYYPIDYAKEINSSTTLKTKSCSIGFIASPNNLELTINGVPCKDPFRYVCERKTKFNSSLCLTLNYTELIEDSYLYGHEELEWREAGDCCEIKGGELFPISAPSEKEDLHTALIDSAILERKSNETLSLWTGGFRKLENYPFTWSNFDPVLYQPIKPLNESEFCLKSTTSGTLKDFTLEDNPCEEKLPFVCRIKAPKKCPAVEMDELSVPDSYRKYYYSGHYKLQWSEAVLCCKERGLQLFSILSPQEGNMLAAYLQKIENTRYKHQSFRNGLWTSGRQHKDGPYEFVSVRTKVKFSKSGKNHYLKGPVNGTCLQYVVDVRNSFVLNNIPCKSIRSFICANVATVPKYYDFTLKNIGNKYFYGNKEVSWAFADEICENYGMKLLNLLNYEEKQAMSLILEQHIGNHTSDAYHGLWSTIPELPFSMEDNPKPSSIRAKEARRKLFRNIEIYHRKLRPLSKNDRRAPYQLTGRANQRKLIGNDSLCSSTYTSRHKMLISNNVPCDHELKFICEKEDPMYGKCNFKSMTSLGPYMYSEKAATWKEAQKCCSMTPVNNRLITLNSQSKLRDLYLYIKDLYQKPRIGIWTSGTNYILQQKWIWTGTYEFVESNNFFNNYTNYDVIANAEDDHECIEAFAHVQEDKLMWDHDDCDVPKPFLCEKNDIESTRPCDDIRFEQLRRTAFYYALGKVRWPQAQECCRQRGMTLAEIHDTAANDKLFSFIAERSNGIHNTPDFGLWIGLTSHIQNHSEFTWVSSMKTPEEFKFSSWNPTFDFPVDPKTSCAVVYTDINSLSWAKVECTNHFRFICQAEKIERL